MRRLVQAYVLVALVACASYGPYTLREPGFYQELSWSPDSKWIAYSRLRDGKWAVFLARADGTGERRLSEEGDNATWSAWSPDGTEVAFSSGSQSHTDLVVASVREPVVRRTVTSDGQANSAPAWSPDGRRLVFTSRRTGKSHVYVVNVDGSDLHPLTSGDANESNPSWSPDGRRVSFYSDVRGKLDTVCTIDADGSHLKMLTPAAMHAIYPGWTPRGDIVFAKANEGEPRAIMLITSDGQLHELDLQGFFARVAPDGKRIAVIDGRYPSSQITIQRFASLAR